MKKLTFLLLISLALGCRKEKDVLPQQVKSFVGNWEQTAFENSKLEWVDTPTDGKPSLIVRFDGVLLNGDGLAICCAPENLTVNGVSFKAEPTSPIPYNEACTRIDCLLCQLVKVQVDKDEMIWSGCGGRTRYRRLP